MRTHTPSRLTRRLAIGLLSLTLAFGTAACGNNEDNNTSNNTTATNNTTGGTNNTTGGTNNTTGGTNNTTGGTNNTTGGTTNNTTMSLYDQLGGETAIRAVLAKFIEKVGADDRINWMFANSDLTALQNQLHDQVCAATGGGCTYSGQDMKTAHTGMAITDAQFDALIEDFLAALDDLSVPYSEALDGSETIDPLLTALVGMRADIVEDAAGDTVYFNQLGGYASVSAVIDGLLTNVAADDRINGFFADTDLAELRRLLIEQVCEATGGYCTYSGRDMKTSHAGLGITDADFDALVEDLLAALDTLGVPYTGGATEGTLADALLSVLSGMRGDIVEAQ